MNRRMVLGITASMLTAGCSDVMAADKSGFVEDSDGVIQNIGVKNGEIIRVEITNETGLVTFVSIDNPSDDIVVDTEVQTEKTIQYDATETGVYTVGITPDGEASYKIYVDSYK